MTLVPFRFWRTLPWLGALFAFWLATGAFAQETDPPGRVAAISFRQGSVVFAPQGEEDWTELPANRPLTSGDRLWSDQGARAELQLGSASVHIDGQSHLGLLELDDRAAHFILQQGTVNARVRELQQGENFEIGTPNVAFRALQPGDYRIDVDLGTQQTRVVVHSGMAAIYGEGGQSVQLGAGQQATFAGRYLAQVQSPAWRPDGFDAWASDRNRAEDQSQAARYLPRGVVGYSQLDPYGTWAQDPSYGAVWYPQVAVADWAPYRYGHWSWIHPWGWTWIDDAPWGFAPFHYGRWTMIANRWAWVPGRMVARPAYAPALVAFMGSGAQFSFSVGSGPGVGWYPLAPGEAWWPAFRTSSRYVGSVNYNVNLHAYPRNFDNHVWRQRPFAATAVSDADFRSGRPVYRHWQAVSPQMINRAQVGVVPGAPQTRQPREPNSGPHLQSQPPATLQRSDVQRFWSGREQAPAVQEQFRARREQDRLQRDADRNAREQIRQQEQQRPPREQRLPREGIDQRPLRDQRVQQDGWQRGPQDQVLRQQQEQRAQREAWQQRQQRDMAQRQHEQGQRQQREQAVRQQEQVQRQQEQVQRMQVEQARREAFQRQREVQGLSQAQQQAVQQAMGAARAAQDAQRHQQAQPQQVQRVPQRQVVPAAQAQPQQGPRGHEGRGDGRWNREGGDWHGRGSRG
jgi:hypothetical protein